MWKKHLARSQQVWVERCPECESTHTDDHDESAFVTCYDCGHFWREGDGKRVYRAVA